MPPSNQWERTAWPDNRGPPTSRTRFPEWRTDQQTLACLGVRARGRNYGGAHGIERGARSGVQKQFNVPLFDCHFVTIFELKCNKQCIQKL
jgi:hypothetical protein